MENIQGKIGLFLSIAGVLQAIGLIMTNTLPGLTFINFLPLILPIISIIISIIGIVKNEKKVFGIVGLIIGLFGIYIAVGGIAWASYSPMGP